jgi:hypothetical protein
MEQTNLVVTPDGKTWDELRDTSYLGPSTSAIVARDGGHVSSSNYYIFDMFRGVIESVNYHTKGIAIDYNRLRILEDGCYQVSLTLTSSTNGGAWRAKLRHTYGDWIEMNQDPDPNEPNSDTCSALLQVKRGDFIWPYILVGTVNGTTLARNKLQIIKIN